MFIDDEQPTLDLLARVLDWEALGLQVAPAAQDGRQALALIEAHAPDILITDIQMPGMNGLELIEAVRRANTAMQIIVLSAHGQFEYAQKALEYHVIGYLLKPIDEEKLAALIQTACRRLRQQADDSRYIRQGLLQLRSDEFRALLYGEHPGLPAAPGQGGPGFFAEELFLLVLRAAPAARPAAKRAFTPGRLQQFFAARGVAEMALTETAPFAWAAAVPAKTLAKCFPPGPREQPLDALLEEALSAAFSLPIQVTHRGPFEDMALLCRAFRSMGEGQSEAALSLPGGENTLITQTVQFLLAHYHRPLSLEDICTHLSVSKNYLSALFSRQAGRTLWACLTDIRMEKAKELLLVSGERTSEIAYRVGYENPNYFSKAFKKATGLSPQEYRSQEKHAENSNI